MQEERLKRQNAAIVLYYIYSTVDAAMNASRYPSLNSDCKPNIIEMAESIYWICNPNEGDVDMDVRKRISNAIDDVLPSSVAFCLQRIWEALPSYEAHLATEMVCATLIGAATQSQLEYLDKCSVLSSGWNGSNMPFNKYPKS